MTITNLRADILVVGAGTAGAAVAARLAERGRQVLLADRRNPEDAGAHWVNAVPAWLFDEAGVSRPEPPELVRSGDRHTSVLADAWGTACQRVLNDPGLHVDMRLLTARLQRRAQDAGVTLLRGRVCDVSMTGNRLRGVTLDTDDGALTVHPRLTIDASGIAGAIRKRTPTLAAACPPPAPTDICEAAQYQHRVTDEQGAREFLARHGALPGANFTRTALEGGYSILLWNVSEDLREVGVLSGTIPTGGARPGAAIVAEFVARQPWIGPRLYGGAAPIPLGQPYTHPTAPGVALVGNAANHVYALHGSGVGMGLIAARVLADAVSGAVDPGDPQVLHRYAARFLRRFGGRLAASDLFRRFSQQLGGIEVAELLRSKIVDGPMLLAGLTQTPFQADPHALQTVLRAAVRHPRLAARLAPVATRILLIQQAYERYPTAPDPRALYRFDQATKRILGF
ncbi:MAG: FAD-dependent oxidoreductase [bacterium]